MAPSARHGKLLLVARERPSACNRVFAIMLAHVRRASRRQQSLASERRIKPGFARCKMAKPRKALSRSSVTPVSHQSIEISEIARAKQPLAPLASKQRRRLCGAKSSFNRAPAVISAAIFHGSHLEMSSSARASRAKRKPPALVRRSLNENGGMACGWRRRTVRAYSSTSALRQRRPHRPASRHPLASREIGASAPDNEISSSPHQRIAVIAVIARYWRKRGMAGMKRNGRWRGNRRKWQKCRAFR